jgi:hypothetical protein
MQVSFVHRHASSHMAEHRYNERYQGNNYIEALGISHLSKAQFKML